MAAQFVPAPGPGAAPFSARPSSPRGLYRSFGAPESLLSIHFPAKKADPKTSNPWYWWYDLQQPQAFSFLFTRWVRLPAFTVIKILKIDTQPLIPIPRVGFTTLEGAVKGGNPDVTWGRFDFSDVRFWELLGQQKPLFDVVHGQIKARDSKTNINATISKAANKFGTNWATMANEYNQIAGGVGPQGFHYPGQQSLFAIPLPHGPPTTVSLFQSQLDAFITVPPGPGAAFIGPIPASAFFNINTFTTQAYAFTMKVGQLDPAKWNMGEFPPREASGIGNGGPSAKTGDYSGFGATPFPVAGPQLV